MACEDQNKGELIIYNRDLLEAGWKFPITSILLKAQLKNIADHNTGWSHTLQTNWNYIGRT